MSGSPKRFVLALNGDIINSDFIVKLRFSGGQAFADMTSGPAIELRVNDSIINDLRRMLPLNPLVA